MWMRSEWRKASIVAIALICCTAGAVVAMLPAEKLKPVIVPNVVSDHAHCTSWTLHQVPAVDGQRLKSGQRFKMSAIISFKGTRVRSASTEPTRKEPRPFAWRPWIRFVRKETGTEGMVYEKPAIFSRVLLKTSTIEASGSSMHAPKRTGAYEMQIVIGKDVRGNFPLNYGTDGEIVARRNVVVEDDS
ncbi:hypothetical protein Pan44_55060 [Caulifigura coniformis]|uniref:Uncharacterized protein n=1 Tax=Caulifigura coniformis TaxID=2527983 RepID=A0A517SMT6_9PLAN|nr:hypothetical protein [Caulifigura coniformis]QDT57437.1 hypothetical protein Pan44_55060 [Caulifigura coniformis]